MVMKNEFKENPRITNNNFARFAFNKQLQLTVDKVVTIV